MRQFLWSLLAFAGLGAGLDLSSPNQLPLSIGRFPSLIDADLEYLADGLKQGLFTSVNLVRAYTLRIHEVNDVLSAVVELNPDAHAIASVLDEERRRGNVRGPLHGIPILVKDNIATNDRMNNTAGSTALVGAKVPRDATVAAKLRNAGAILLGKTNLSEWANYRALNISDGWSAHGGQSYAAYYPGQSASGSSSGSGVATSIGLALASLGTETSGSIVSPADVSNIVGIKPTVGLTSRYLVIPISERQDTVGPLARTVKDAAYVLQAIAGADPRDNYTSDLPYPSSLPDYVAACNYDALEGARLGVAWNVLEKDSDPDILSAFNTALEQIRQAGATIVDANFTAFDRFLEDDSGGVVMGTDFLSDVPKYLAELVHNPANITTLADITNFTHSTPAETWPKRDTLIWDKILARSWNNTDPRFWAAYQKNLFYGGEGGVLGALYRTNTSAILLPTSAGYSIPALVGSPIVSVPMGSYPAGTPPELDLFGDLVTRAPNIPFGISFLGLRWSEAELIGLAYAYEQRSMNRFATQPYIKPNIELADVVVDLPTGEVFQTSDHSYLWSQCEAGVY